VTEVIMEEKKSYIIVGIIMLICIGVIVYTYVNSSTPQAENEQDIIEVSEDQISDEEAMRIAQFYGGEEFEYNLQDELVNNDFIIEVKNPETGIIEYIYRINSETGVLLKMDGIQSIDISDFNDLE